MWLEGVYESHKNETIDDWIVDDDLCEEIFPIKKVSREKDICIVKNSSNTYI